MSIFDKYYQSPNFDSSRLGSSQGPSNQSMQYFDEDEEDMEAEALLEQFLADGVITDEERAILSASSDVVAAVPGIKNIRNPGAFDPTKVEPIEPVGPPTTVGESIRQTYNESVLADLIGRGFGQEAFQSKAPDGTPTFGIYNKRFGTLGSQVPYSEASPEAKAQAMRFMLETGGVERPLPETPTSPVLTPEQVQNILNEERAAQAAQDLETAAVNNSLPAGMTMNQSDIMNALSDQVQEATDALPAGVQRGSPQANFLETFAESDGDLTDKQIAQFRREARDMGTTFNPETGFSRDPFLSAQASRTSTPLPGQTLSQFLRYEDSPEQRTEQFVDAQGRLRNRFTPEAAQLQGLSDFVQPSLDEREMRLAERDRRPGETQTQRDTRIAQSRTTGAQTEGLSFDEARRRAEGELAARGVRNPSASQVNALARSIQEAEPERLEALRIKTAKDEARLNFEPKVVEREGKKFVQLAPEYFTELRPEPKEDELFQPRILENNGFIYFETKPNDFERQPDTGQTPQQLVANFERTGDPFGLTPIEAPTPIETTTAIEGDAKGNKKLDKETARSIFNEAGGDAELARQIARERGFVL